MTESEPNPQQSLTRAQQAAAAKRFGEARGICDDLLGTQPDLPPALALQGIIAAHQQDTARAIDLLERANTRQPGQHGWLANLCTLYRLECRLQEALNAGTESIRLAPNNADYLVNLSLVYTDLDDRDRALACLLRALGINDKHPDAHLAMAQNLLAQGEYVAGWLEYEWRNETEVGRGQLPKITSAPWNGMPIPGGRILLVGDQGYGDTIQFARYIPKVAELCSEVILGCSAELLPLIRRVPGVTHAHHRWNEIPGHAAHTRLSSLPMLFQTTEATIPPPVMKVDLPKMAGWAKRLATLQSGKLIGLAWSGRPTHPNDKRRSLTLKQLGPLFAAPGERCFVSLQKPIPERDMADMGMQDWSAELTDFDETAALIRNLDLVITIDTAVAHLAGALGVPCWIMLPKASDWRWLLDRTDSPWYPSVRLFRQHYPGEWNVVIAEVAQALSEYLAADEKVAAE